jgi:hypothetical protein
MWLQDLEKALGQLIDCLGVNACCTCVDKIVPAADGGIVFYLSNFDTIKWYPDNHCERHKKGDWRK